jgi:hypothetical protein
MLHTLRVALLLLVGLAALAAHAADPRPETLSDQQLLQILTPSADVEGRCGTPYAVELLARGLELASPAEAAEDTLYYDTPEGHFVISYTVLGTNAVDPTDTDASGVPDYVELVGSACERSWSVEIDSLGFTGPDLGGERYVVSTIFGLNYFGLTNVNSASPGGSDIRIRFSMAPFCTRTDDPETCEVNALLVTVAHEFKHAIQIASGWDLQNVGGWIELDATWIEDVVFDDSNDYYRFIASGTSPFMAPQVTLVDASYEDCTWQHYLSENWGSEFILDYDAELVAGLPGQSAQVAFQNVAEDRGLDWVELWGNYTTATYLSGGRAVDGRVFEEGAFYPQAVIVPIPELPHTTTLNTLSDMAMAFYEFDSAGSDETGRIDIEFSGSGGVPWTLRAVFQRADELTVVPIEVVEGAAFFRSSQLVEDYDRFALLLGNSRVPPFNVSSGSYSIAFGLHTVPNEAKSVSGFKGRFRRPSGN